MSDIPMIRLGEIDFVPEYLGTLGFFLGVDNTGDADTVLGRVSDAYGALGVAVLDYAPAEDKNAIVVTAEVASEYGLTKISDLAASAG